MRIKKNDRAYLQDLKIEILGENDISFQELCLVFDKPEFLNMLPGLRNDLEIKGTISLDNCSYETYDVTPNSKKKKKINFLKYRGIEKLKEFAKANESFLSSGGIEEEMNMFQLAATEISLVCIQFNRPPYFAEAIRQAIFYGTASSESLGSTSTEVIESSNACPTASYFKLPQVAIFVSPTSTYENVKDALRQAKGLYKTDKRLIYYQPRVDIAPNIRKYRDWYWERIKGKTYQVIADEWVEKFENETTTYLDVLKALKTYEKLLVL